MENVVHAHAMDARPSILNPSPSEGLGTRIDVTYIHT